MRRYIKRRMLELLHTMQEAAAEIPSMAGKKNAHQLTELLAGQQDAAIAIGSQVEASEGEGTKAVRLLEEYCELLWEINRKPGLAAGRNGVIRLKLLLGQAEQELERLQEQLDVVFLPYKASMWDCMESVWQAACEDPGCFPVVMPIPYFNMQDGQVTERHYEGDSFPPYVHVTDYRELSLEELRPDIIFIHNPFDGNNKITSVLPQYYSEKLKAVTGRLVYIPYYVTGEAVYVAHRYLPSYKNMDFIVTQCEKMIDSYAADIPREKFLPFGSPVADRILRLEREKPAIPEEWKPMLPNGRDFGGSRTVMLNTSISLLTQQKARFLNKIEYLLDTTKRMEGITLVWRPHPLLRAAAQAMGKEYIDRLDALERRFLEERIGVLDRTPDVGVTVALCDAYLGETASALIHMFGIAGKPRFYIELAIPKLSGYIGESVYTVSGHCETEEAEYFLLDEAGWIVEKSRDTGRIAPLVRIPGREAVRGKAYRGMEREKGCLWVYPENAEGIFIYDLGNGRMRKIFPGHTGGEDGKQESKVICLPEHSECAAVIRAERFKRGNWNHEWYEGEKYCVEDFFRYLRTEEEQKLAGYQGAYPVWLANLDGSCGRKVLQAVKESLHEEG